MSSDRELINNYEQEITIQSNLSVFPQIVDEHHSSANLNTPIFQSHARGKCVTMLFAHIGGSMNSSCIAHEKDVHNLNIINEYISRPIMISSRQGSSAELDIETTSILNNESSSIVVEINQLELKNEELVNEFQTENGLLSSLSKNSTKNLNNNHITRREDIENEIEKMVQGIVALKDDDDNEPLCIADCYCHLDILFQKLNNPNQTVDQYLHYNSSIYNKGIDMVYVIQSFFAPPHIRSDNWNNIYKKYLDHPCIYATTGISPLFAHHYDMNMELDLRRTLNHAKVIAVGEIGLDFEAQSRPDDCVQIAAFIQQLRIAKEKNLPIVLISRNSFIQTLQCLSDELDSNHRIHWRNFYYNKEELEMLHSKMNNIFFGCSPQVLSNKKLQMNIEKVLIDFLLPESGAPHMNIEECPHVWNTHPLFAIQVYRVISHLFQLPIRKTVDKLVNNVKYFYQLK